MSKTHQLLDRLEIDESELRKKKFSGKEMSNTMLIDPIPFNRLQQDQSSQSIRLQNSKNDSQITLTRQMTVGKRNSDKVMIPINTAKSLLVAPLKKKNSKRNSLCFLPAMPTTNDFQYQQTNDQRTIGYGPQISIDHHDTTKTQKHYSPPSSTGKRRDSNLYNILSISAFANKGNAQMQNKTRQKSKFGYAKSQSSSNEEIIFVQQMSQPLVALNPTHGINLVSGALNTEQSHAVVLQGGNPPSVNQINFEKPPAPLQIEHEASEMVVDRLLHQINPLYQNQDNRNNELSSEERANIRSIQRQHLMLYNGRINKKIMSMDIEDVNRNTRFFKDYLKDQLKGSQNQSKSKSKSKGPTLARQDSLTEQIQKESAAPLRRMSIKHQDERMDQIKKQRLIQAKTKIIGKSFKTKKTLPKNALTTTNNPVYGVTNSITEESYKYTTSQADEEQDPQKLKRQEKHIYQITFQGDGNDEEYEEEINEDQIRRIDDAKLHTCLLYPDSMFRSFVDVLSFLLLLLISLYIPFILSFDVDTSGSFNYFEVVIDSWFLLEIFINFFTGYYDKGILIMDRRKICLTYLQGWFLIDIFSSIPISYIDLATQDEMSTQSPSSTSISAYQSAKLIRILRMTKYARLIRLLRFLKVNKLLLALEVVIVSEQASLFVKFSKISIILMFVTHWVACVLYSIASDQYDEKGRNWLMLQRLQDASIAEIYVNCLYWAFTTMCTVGYGDFHPVTSMERLVSIICMLVSSGMFAFIIGDIGRMVSNFNLLAAQFRERMIYVDKFLRIKQIPINLRQQVKRYLEYNWAQKKLYKIEEQELLNLLNDNLKGKITVYFNGKILQNIDVLCKFPIEFLSNLSFILQKQTFAIDDNLIVEKESGNELFFMVSGKVSVIHRKTKTHITDLFMDSYFGEISFFSELQRQATVISRDFSEVLILPREDFLQMALKVSEDALLLYHKIRESINYGEKEYRQLSIRCYICNAIGHIAIDCKQFNRLKGNLKRYFKKLYQESAEDSQSDNGHKQNPLVVSMVSQDEQQQVAKDQMKHLAIRRKTMKQEQEYQTAKRKNTKKLPTNNPVRFESAIKKENSLRNFVVFPLALQDSINKSDDEISQSKYKKAQNKKIYNGNMKRHSSIKKQESIGVKKAPQKTIQKQPSRTPLMYQTQDSEQHPAENFIQFDTPRKEDEEEFKAPQSTKFGFLKQNSKRTKDVIQEEDEDLEEEKDKTCTQILSVVGTSGNEADESDESERPLLTQRIQQVTIRAPKSQNSLTKLIGRRKNFGSKSKREQHKQEDKKNQVEKRQINIMPLNDIKKEVKTVVKKTFTTLVETYTEQQVGYGKKSKQSPLINISSREKSNDEKKKKKLRAKQQENLGQYNNSKLQEVDQRKGSDWGIFQEESKGSLVAKNKNMMNSSDSYGEIQSYRKPLLPNVQKPTQRNSKFEIFQVSEDEDIDNWILNENNVKKDFNNKQTNYTNKPQPKVSPLKKSQFFGDHVNEEEEFKIDDEEEEKIESFYQKHSKINKHSFFQAETDLNSKIFINDQKNAFRYYETSQKKKEQKESSQDKEKDEVVKSSRRTGRKKDIFN